MTSCAQLAADNIGYLKQSLDLLDSIDDAAYANAAPATYGSALGGHLRHCLDHYANFLGGLPAGRIDYDARQRDPRIERERAVAAAKIRELIDGLSALGDDRAVKVKMDCGARCDESTWWTDSTLRRELQFLVSHTVHHYALIKLILKFQGRSANADFGIAPSTLRYNESKSACAR